MYILSKTQGIRNVAKWWNQYFLYLLHLKNFSLTLGENFNKDLHWSWNHAACGFKLLYVLFLVNLPQSVTLEKKL